MIPFSLVGIASGLWTIGIDYVSEVLIQDHLSGSSKKLLSRIFLGAFLAGSFAILFTRNSPYLFGHTLFISLLGVTLFSDIRVMLISRFVTLYTIPFALLLGALDLLPVSLFTSMLGCLIGYYLLVFVAKVGARSFGQEALGQGDIDLIAMIGAFTGPVGCWFTLSIGSILGTFVGFVALAMGHQKQNLRLPFGTFLAMGAIIFTLFSQDIYSFFSLS